MTARELEDVGKEGRIVVGIDGSPSSKSALVWAAEQARLTGSRLLVVATWHLPFSYGFAPNWPSNVDLASDTTSALENAVAEVLGPNPDVEITMEVIEGHPAPVLAKLSRTATLIVVGSRGHGEFAGMLLGSVSEFLTTHAHCPVVVIRDGHEGDKSG